MQKILVYIPMDRRHALAHGESLPERTSGSALFADISGFTPLTEALVRELGPQRGAEELTNYLNLVYDAVVDEIHRYGGSVIAFAGDAITCWFDERDIFQKSSPAGSDGGLAITAEQSAAIRATDSALAIQQVMQRFTSVQTPNGTAVALSIKAAVASGPVRRFMVGDPDIRVLDALAGETLVRLAAGEHLAEKGEVILDAQTVQAYQQDQQADRIRVADLRYDQAYAEPFSVVSRVEAGADREGAQSNPLLSGTSVVAGSAELDLAQIDPQLVRTWLLPFVYERINLGLEEFLAELRPTVALFLRFGGIDYDGDEDAGQKLDRYIRWVESVVAQYEGTLIDLNIGDKGSYIYINFGAPLAHENNAARAALAALALRNPPAEFEYMEPVQLGISQGRMRAGVYGGTNHRTYGVLGDEVNMSARLMMKAQPGQVLVSEAAWHSIAEDFIFEALPPMRVKGKSEPVNVFVLKAQQSRQWGTASGYASPMVGRQQELTQLQQCLADAAAGQGQLMAITGEAGVGKSRLLAEVVRAAETQRWQIQSGSCESYGTNSSYMVWQPIWRGLLGVGSNVDSGVDAGVLNSEERARQTGRHVAQLAARIAVMDPDWVPRVPLLAPILQLAIPENEFTSGLDAKIRKTALHSFLVDILRHLVNHSNDDYGPFDYGPFDYAPLLLILEDCHWIDGLSMELLETIAQAVPESSICLLLLCRELTGAQITIFDESDHATVWTLTRLQPEETATLISQKLWQLSGTDIDVSQSLATQLDEQAQGNPFFVEEVTAYLYFQGYFEDGGGARSAEAHGSDAHEEITLNLPDSLHRLVLSRLDQLSEGQKVAARVASVIGRVFRAAWLEGVYPQLGEYAKIRADLEILQHHDLTVPQTAEPELTYFFKQVLTQTATYESLPHAMRGIIHNQIGAYIEEQFFHTLDAYLDLLVYHYDNSENVEKRKEYLLKGAEAAQAKYANATAIDYYQHLLPLLSPPESIAVQRKLGQVLELTGQWDAARAMYEQGLAASVALADQQNQAWCEAALGQLTHKQGNFDDARAWLQKAQVIFEEINDSSGIAQVLHLTGTMAAQQGDYDLALDNYRESLARREKMSAEIGEQKQAAYLLGNMGIISRRQGEPEEAKALYEQSLAIRRKLADRWGIANSLNNLGNITAEQGDLETAHQFLEEALTIHRQLGDRWEIGNALNNLGNVVRDQGNYAAASALYAESLAIYGGLGDKWALAYLLEDVGSLLAKEGIGEPSLVLINAASVLRTEIDAPLTPSEKESLDADFESIRESMDATVQVNARSIGLAMSLAGAIEYARTHLEETALK